MGEVPTTAQFHWLCCQCREASPSGMAQHTQAVQTPHHLLAVALGSMEKLEACNLREKKSVNLQAQFKQTVEVLTLTECL